MRAVLISWMLERREPGSVGSASSLADSMLLSAPLAGQIICRVGLRLRREANYHWTFLPPGGCSAARGRFRAPLPPAWFAPHPVALPASGEWTARGYRWAAGFACGA